MSCRRRDEHDEAALIFLLRAAFCFARATTTDAYADETGDIANLCETPHRQGAHCANLRSPDAMVARAITEEN
jgi:hypothetical protein